MVVHILMPRDWKRQACENLTLFSLFVYLCLVQDLATWANPAGLGGIPGVMSGIWESHVCVPVVGAAGRGEF